MVIPVAARLRVLRQADDHRLGSRPHRGCLDRADAAPGIHAVRRPGRRLGRPDHRRDRCQGTAGAARHPLEHARDRPARGLEGPRLERLRDRLPGADRAVRRRAARVRPAGLPLHEGRRLRARDGRCARRRCTGSPIRRSPSRPGCSTTTRTASRTSPGPSPASPIDNLTRDEVLDNITMTWLTNTGISSGRLYWENKLGFFDIKGVTVPAAVSVFPRELYQAPRSWTEQAYPKPDLLPRGRPGQPLRGLGGAAALRRGAPRGVPIRCAPLTGWAPRREPWRFGPVKQIEAGDLDVGYAESGPADGPGRPAPARLAVRHPQPSPRSRRCWPRPATGSSCPICAATGRRVSARPRRVRNGQQAALAVDAIALLDALEIRAAIVAGFDWGARTADIMAALWPERCRALVSVSGYLIGSREANRQPLPPGAELAWWYQFYFATERGRAGYEQYTPRVRPAHLADRLAEVGASTTPPSIEARPRSTIPTTSTSSSTTTAGGSASPTASRDTTSSRRAWPRVR